jgi:hypothetical protein
MLHYSAEQADEGQYCSCNPPNAPSTPMIFPADNTPTLLSTITHLLRLRSPFDPSETVYVSAGTINAGALAAS